MYTFENSSVRMDVIRLNRYTKVAVLLNSVGIVLALQIIGEPESSGAASTPRLSHDVLRVPAVQLLWRRGEHRADQQPQQQEQQYDPGQQQQQQPPCNVLANPSTKFAGSGRLGETRDTVDRRGRHAAFHGGRGDNHSRHQRRIGHLVALQRRDPHRESRDRPPGTAEARGPRQQRPARLRDDERRGSAHCHVLQARGRQPGGRRHRGRVHGRDELVGARADPRSSAATSSQ